MSQHQLDLATKTFNALQQQDFKKGTPSRLVDKILQAMQQARVTENHNTPEGGEPRDVFDLLAAKLNGRGTNAYDWNADDIRTYLGRVKQLAQYGDNALKAIATIGAGTTDSEFEAALSLTKETEALGDLKSMIQQSINFGDTLYEPAPDYVDARFTLPHLFAEAGLSTDVFSDDARPPLTELLALVHAAEKERGLLNDGRGAALAAS